MTTAMLRRQIILLVLLIAVVTLPAPGWTQQAPSPPPAPAQPTPAPPPAPPVKAIEVRGNVRVPADQILAVISATKVGEPLSDERIRADVRAINELGLFADVSARLETDPDGVILAFLVTENPVLAEIVIEGNTVATTDEVRTALGVPLDEVLNLNRLRAGAQAVQKVYEGKGYALARVADIVLLPVETPVGAARLRLRISEGIVEAVRFEGLKKTQLPTAQQYIRETKAGALFNLQALNRDLQRLFDSGLFESVRARPEPGTHADSAVIVIELKEARTTQASFGLGYSSRDGLLGFIEFRDRNWQGRAQSFAVRVERAVQTQTADQLNYEISFNEPFLDAGGTGLGLSLFSRTTIEQEYDPSGTVTSRFNLERTGAIATLTRPIDGVTALSFRLKSELTEITLLEGVPPALSAGKVISFQLGFTRDNRDNRFTPTAGDKLALATEFALQSLGSGFEFTKYSLDYQRLFPAGSGTFVARVFAGSATGLLPVQDQFILGGPSTVRALPSGFDRGDSMVVANVEYRLPMRVLIPAFEDVSLILFADAGKIPLDFVDPHIGYGVGIALSTPLGPIRIDLAFGPEGQQTWLSLGAPF